MKYKICSDIHVDVNNNLKSYFKNKDYDVMLCAGDIAGSLKSTKKFLETYCEDKKVIFINGNHCVYNNEHKTLQQINKEYAEEFPIDKGNWNFLNNNYMQLDENTYIIGSTLYTDYQYSDYKIENMINAVNYLNDFKWGWYEENNEKVRLHPNHYFNLHKESLIKIKFMYNEILEINPNAKIILMTHHGMSKRCISKKYLNSNINASYTSYLEEWILKEIPKIKLIISGHIHDYQDFDFGTDENKIRYIMNPLGYMMYGEDENYNDNLIVEI